MVTTRHPRHGAGRGRRGAALPSDARACQARRLFRRSLPDHRLHAEQLHQLRPAQDSSSRAAIQVALAQPASAHGMERRGRRASASSSRFSARRNASASIGISGPPTRCIRTCIPSCVRTPNSSSCCRAMPYIYKMDYGSKMLRFHMERGAGATLAGFRSLRGSQPLRRAAGGRDAGSSPGFSRSPRISRPAIRCSRRWGSISST